MSNLVECKFGIRDGKWHHVELFFYQVCEAVAGVKCLLTGGGVIRFSVHRSRGALPSVPGSVAQRD